MTSDNPWFAVPSTPEFLLLAADAPTTAEATLSWAAAGLAVRALRGRKMRFTGRLMDEVGAALQFPYYFGENWAALDECLSDLEWLDPNAGLVLIVRDAAEVLVEEPREELEALVTALRAAAHTYATPIDDGEWWDRPAVPLHVVLQADRADAQAVADRWGAAGAATAPLVL